MTEKKHIPNSTEEQEISGFIQEMRDFRGSVMAFMQDMRDMKSDMLTFRTSTLAFKRDMSEFKQEMRAEIGDVRRDTSSIQEGMFSKEEKESIVAAADTLNQQLEDSVLGKKDISLTRPEYDKTAIASGFANRFDTPASMAAE